MWNFSWIEWIGAALVGFVIGGLWYGPLFGKTWQRLSGLSDEEIGQSNMAMVFGGTFLLNLVASGLLGHMYAASASGNPSFRAHLMIGAGIGAGFVGTSLGVNALFSRRSLPAFLIDAGYWTLAYTGMALVYALIG